MPNYAIVDTTTNTVINVISYDQNPGNPPPGFANTVISVQSDTASIGWTYNNGVLAGPPPNVPSYIPTISDRQFFQQLATQNTISNTEALAAVQTGTLPATMANLVSSLPANQQFSATMILTGATVFERNNPLTITLGELYGWTNTQIDQLFIDASQL